MPDYTMGAGCTHARKVTFQMAEVGVLGRVFGQTISAFHAPEPPSRPA